MIPKYTGEWNRGSIWRGDTLLGFSMRITDKAEADSVLVELLAPLRIGDYHRHDIGIHTECLTYDEEGACTESLTWEGYHVDLISVAELDIPAVYVKNPLPEAQIHAFFI